jgi:hypothetical protein
MRRTIAFGVAGYAHCGAVTSISILITGSTRQAVIIVAASPSSPMRRRSTCLHYSKSVASRWM